MCLVLHLSACCIYPHFAVLLGAIGYRVVVASKRKAGQDKSTADAYSNLATPQPSTDTDYSTREPKQISSQEYLANDVRNDKALLLYRIDQSEIQLGAIDARGDFGIIYRGVFDGRSVAVKQMLPDTWRSEATVSTFMDEIRMCARLDHPKIVRCVGISWSSLRDLSVVIEYMSGGDLHGLLHKQTGVSSGREWSEPWTTSNIKSKTSIASDVAEAVVYLHSFSSPIIHRDLKAKNVLLDSTGNAKLSDFGISREMSVDETMTKEVGTAAWIAPEVLRGERYSEKADIYSLGILLVEMDRCRHPYSTEQAMAVDDGHTRSHEPAQRDTTDRAVLNNAQLALLVSTGMLRSTTSASCPEAVRNLVSRCVDFDASQRPTAMAVHYELRQLRAAANHQ